MAKAINIAQDFSETPFGRYRAMSDFCGEAFRDDILLPALKSEEKVTVTLDGTLGYGSSFLEEVFGGLVRNSSFTAGQLKNKLTLISEDDPSLLVEIWDYINQGKPKNA